MGEGGCQKCHVTICIGNFLSKGFSRNKGGRRGSRNDTQISHVGVGGWGVLKVQKKYHVLFEWPLIVETASGFSNLCFIPQMEKK